MTDTRTAPQEDQVARIADVLRTANFDKLGGWHIGAMAEAIYAAGLRLTDSRVGIAEPPESAVSGLVSSGAGPEDGNHEREGVDAEAAVPPDRAGRATVGLRLPELRQGTGRDADGLVPAHADPEGVVQPALGTVDIAEPNAADLAEMDKTVAEADMDNRVHHTFDTLSRFIAVTRARDALRGR